MKYWQEYLLNPSHPTCNPLYIFIHGWLLFFYMQKNPFMFCLLEYCLFLSVSLLKCPSLFIVACHITKGYALSLYSIPVTDCDNEISFYHPRFWRLMLPNLIVLDQQWTVQQASKLSGQFFSKPYMKLLLSIL